MARFPYEPTFEERVGENLPSGLREIAKTVREVEDLERMEERLSALQTHLCVLPTPNFDPTDAYECRQCGKAWESPRFSAEWRPTKRG